MFGLKTQPDLLAALSASATREMSAYEVQEQRVSFIMGALHEKSGVSRARVNEVLAKHDGRRQT